MNKLIEIESSLNEKLKIHAIKQGTNANELIRRQIERKIAEGLPKRPPRLIKKMVSYPDELNPKIGDFAIAFEKSKKRVIEEWVNELIQEIPDDDILL